MDWTNIYEHCLDVDVIIDERISESLIWQGGLTKLVSYGALSCQSIESREISVFGNKGLILISNALVGDVVEQIETIVKSKTVNSAWKELTIITASSGIAHLMHHNAEHDFNEQDVFDQFRLKIIEWNPNLSTVQVFSAVKFDHVDFKIKQETMFLLINKPVPLLKPSSIQVEASPFFALNKLHQIQISDFAESVLASLCGRQADIWTCGSLAHMVGTRIGKKNNTSEKKTCIIVFDRSCQFQPETSETCGFDSIFAYCPANSLNNVKAEFFPTLSTNLTLPTSEREDQLYATLFENSLQYARKIAASLFEEIFAEEEIEFNNNGVIEDYLELINKYPEALMYNAGFVSLTKIICIAELNQTAKRANKAHNSVGEIKQSLDDGQLDTKNFVVSILDLFSKENFDEDDFQMLISSFCLHIHSNVSDYPFIQKDASLDEIVDQVNPKFEYLYSNITKLKADYSGLGFMQILENLFIGLPVPNFIRHHEEGLMGKLSSGFGLFGGGTKKSEPKDYKEVNLVFCSGITFNEIRQIQLLSDKIGIKFNIITNGFYTKHNILSWL